MKSAIFQDQTLANASRSSRKPPQKKWPRTASPFAAPNTVQPSPTWNLDDMISNYTVSGQLPPPLSPTLPPRFATNSKNETGTKPESDDDDDVDTDSLPLSLLSPTLPSMFKDSDSKDLGDFKESKPVTPALTRPLPEKPTTVHSVLHGNARTPKSPRVRWVDKRSDKTKPRFLLRIAFASPSGYKRAVASRSPRKLLRGVSPETPQGLAISGLGSTQEPVFSGWPRSYKSFLVKYSKSPKEDSLVAIVVQFDWVICSAIACDFEFRDHRKSIHKDDSWTHLLAQIPAFVHRIERFIKSNNVSDRKKAYLSFLVGILAVCKALILKRANAVLFSGVDIGTEGEHILETKQRKIDIQARIIQNYGRIEEFFAESQSFFRNSPSPATICPKTWGARAQAPPKTSDTPMKPYSDAYFLPLAVYSDLKEACAFLHCCLKEFNEGFDIEFVGGGRYQFQSETPQAI